MKELHLSDPSKTSSISNQLNLEYGIKESIDDQKRHIQKIRSFQDATDYILNLTTTGKTIPTNAGLLFEHYVEHVFKLTHVGKNNESGDSVDELKFHYEIKYCVNDNGRALFHHLKSKDAINYFIFGYKNSSTKEL